MFRRENRTRLRRDFVIADGLSGPGRFVGCVVGVRVLDGGQWYGEGEVKVYLDGDTDLPTICGTGLEDYVGTAGHGRAPDAVRGRPAGGPRSRGRPNPDFVGFYRWHVPDPIMFARDLRVTIQQIGYEVFRAGDEDRMAAKEPAGDGWRTWPRRGDVIGMGLRSGSTTTAVAYVMCAEPSPYPGSTSPRRSTSAAGTTRRVGHGVVRHGNAYPIGAAPGPHPGDGAGRTP